MRILGVDPGSRFTGYGCIDQLGNQLRHVTHGTLRLPRTSGKSLVPFEERLLAIYNGLSEIIREFQPQIMVVEKVFIAKNPLSALKLGEARGAAVLTGKIHQMELAEYNPTQVKLAIVGHGQAAKDQVAKMVQILIGPQEFSTYDASDGLALAICHAQFIRSIGKNQSAHLRSLQGLSKQRNKKRFTLAESVGATLPKKV